MASKSCFLPFVQTLTACTFYLIRLFLKHKMTIKQNAILNYMKSIGFVELKLIFLCIGCYLFVSNMYISTEDY